MNLRKRARNQASDYEEEYTATGDFRTKPPPYQPMNNDAIAIQPMGHQESGTKSFSIAETSTISRGKKADDFEVEESCALERNSEHKSCQLRYLVWVAYTRNKTSNMQLSEAERRTCPLKKCRKDFPTQQAMLDHVYNCPHLFNDLHFCGQCQKPERASKFHCPRCQGKPSRADRLAAAAKKLFSRLGTKSQKAGPSSIPAHSEHLEDCCDSNFLSPVDSKFPVPQKTQCKCGESKISELPVNQIFEAGNTHKSIYELNNEWNLPYLQNSEAHEMPDKYEQPSELAETSLSDLDTPQYENRWDSTHRLAPSSGASTHTSRCTSLSAALPPLDTKSARISVDRQTQEIPDRPRPDSVIISPLSANEMRTINPAFLQVSPTDSEKSGNSFSSDSGYASMTNQSWDSSSTCVDLTPADGGDSFDLDAIIEDYTHSRPATFWNDEMNMNEMKSSMNLDSVHTVLTKQEGLSSHWSDAPGLVTAFSRVLKEHRSHSKSKLREMQQTETVKELYSMSPSSIVSNGLDVLAAILQGRRPTTITALFAFTHIAYAFAMSVEREPLDLAEWYEESSLWIAGLRHSRERIIYSKIAAHIWKPDGNDYAPRNKHLDLVSPAAFLESKFVKISKHFLDILESFGQPEDRSPTSATNFTYQMSHPKSIPEQLMYIVDPGLPFQLMNAGLGCFLTDVTSVNMKLKEGAITDIRGLELQLICAGKRTSQSDVIYWRFLDHVAKICDPVYVEQNHLALVMSRIDYHLRDIDLVRHLVPEAMEIGESMIADFDFYFDDGQQPEENTAGALIQEKNQTCSGLEGFKFQFKPPNASQVNVASLYQSPIQASAENSVCVPENKYKCQYCGYEPNGEEKWKLSNLARHKKTQHRNEKSRPYACAFPGCQSTFTRSDNLKNHHRYKGHGDEGTQPKRYIGQSQKRRKEADEKEFINFF